MADLLETLTTLGAGAAQGAVKRKRENELIQLRQGEQKQAAQQQRISSLNQAILGLAQTGQFDLDTVVQSLASVPTLVRGERGAEALQGLTRLPAEERPPTPREKFGAEQQIIQEKGEATERGLVVKERGATVAEQKLTEVGRQFDADLVFRREQLQLKRDEAKIGANVPFKNTPKGTDLTLKFFDRAEKISKDFNIVVDNLANIESAVQRASADPEIASRVGTDQVVIISFNKILDPTSVVRESEYERTPQNVSLVNRASAAMQRIRRGGVLTLEDLVELRDTAVQMAQLRRDIVNKKLEKIRKTAGARKLDPEEVAPLFEPIESIIGGFSAVQQQQLQQEQPTEEDAAGFLKRLRGEGGL